MRTGVTVDLGAGFSANASYAAVGRTFFDERNTTTFAQKAYESSLESLEAARVEANRQSRYLEAFVRPILPDSPVYPNRPLSVMIVTLCALAAWLISMLIYASVKEHL